MAIADLVSRYLRSRVYVTGGTGGGGPGYGYRGSGPNSYLGPAIPGISIGMPAIKPWDLISARDLYEYPPMYRAMTLLSTSVAKIPCAVKTVQTIDGYEKKTVDREHRSFYPIAIQGNREQTAMVVKAQMVWNAVENGASCAGIIDSKVSGKRELLPFMPGDWWKERIDGELYYILDLGQTGNPDNMRKLRPAEVFELTMPQPDGLQPVAPWWAARRAIYEGLRGGEVRSARAANKGRPHLAFTTDVALQDKTLRRIQTDIANIHSGLDENMVPMILDNGLKPTQLQYAADQKNESDLWRIPVSDISNITGVPVSMLGDFDAGGYDSLEADVKKFYEFGVSPWLAAHDDEANAKMLTQEERESGNKIIEHQPNPFRGLDSKTLMEVARGLTGGAPTALINETRSILFGWGPLDDKVANELLIPKNMGDDGSTAMPAGGAKNGRPAKRASAEISLATSTAKRVCGRITGRAEQLSTNIDKYLAWSAEIKSRYAGEVATELSRVFAVIAPDFDVAELVSELVDSASLELNAVADACTAKADFPAAVEASGKKLVRQWVRIVTSKLGE